MFCRFGPWATLCRRANRLKVRAAPANTILREISAMTISSAIRAALVALTAFAGATLSSAALAEEGTVSLVIYKAGWIIGGSGGSGVLNFQGRRYPLSTGGLDYGLVFGGSKTVLRGR